MLKDENGKLSLGRILSAVLFFVCIGMWLFIKITGKDLDTNDVVLIQWGWGISIIGKGISKFAENMKK